MNLRKIITALMASALLAFSLCAVAGCAKSSEQVITETIEKEFDTYKNKDDSAMTKIAEKAEQEGLTDLGINGDDFASVVLDGFDYTINSVTVDGDTAKADMTIVSKSYSDFESQLEAAIKAFVGESSTATLSESEMNQEIGSIAMEVFQSTQTISENVTLDFKLEKDVWTPNNMNETLEKLDSIIFAA